MESSFNISPDWTPDNRDLEWEYDLRPMDITRFLRETETGEPLPDAPEEPVDFHCFCSVHFPSSDLPTVLTRMRRYNGEQA